MLRTPQLGSDARNLAARVVVRHSTLAVLLGAAGNLLGAELRVPADYPTIRAAIDASVAGDVVLVSPGIYEGLGNRDLVLPDHDLTVEGEGAGATIECGSFPDQGNEHRGFDIQLPDESAARIIVRNVEVRGGTGVIQAEFGGAAYVFGGGSIDFVGCRFVRNGLEQVTTWGGALAVGGPARVTVRECTFRENTSDSGHAIGMGGIGTLQVLNCRFQDNRGYATAAICTDGSRPGTTYIYGCVFENNWVGIAARIGGVTVEECTFVANGSLRWGGAVEVGDDIEGGSAVVVIDDSVISANSASSRGGGICVWAGELRMSRTILFGNCLNNPPGMGRDLYVHGGSATLSCCCVSADGVAGEVTLDRCVRESPRFCEPPPCGVWDVNEELRLLPDSPCLAKNNLCGVDIGGALGTCGSGPLGACCLPEIGCVLRAEGDCLAAGGKFDGGAECLAETCAPPTATERTTWGRLKQRYGSTGNQKSLRR
ncbi:MAG: right-handed parallel beta-helix repeat-containing protein [Candidatus Eisenbacteria bacterium]|nr:right-handed parallel beta-helix repeat-containing protein [Candidatus Eisenbacteria bacterium]